MKNVVGKYQKGLELQTKISCAQIFSYTVKKQQVVVVQSNLKIRIFFSNDFDQI